QSVRVDKGECIRHDYPSRFLIYEPAQLDWGFFALDVEQVEAAGPPLEPLGGRPGAVGQMRLLVLVSRVIGDEFNGQLRRCGVEFVTRENHRVALLPEFTRRIVGGVALMREEGIENQPATGSQAIGGEFEYAAQLTGAPEVGD